MGDSLNWMRVGHLALATLLVAALAGCDVDTTPPAAPTGVSASAASCSSMTVVWNASADVSGIFEYRVYNGLARVATVPAAQPRAAVISGLAASTSYSFTVTAVDASSARNESGKSVSSPATSTTACQSSGNPGDVMWSQNRGGSDPASATGRGVAVDGDGNVIMTGNFKGTANFGTGTVTDHDTGAGGGDVVLAKYTSSGVPVWTRTFGGAGTDIAYGVAVDRRANCDGQGGTNCIVITGFFSQTVDFGGGPLTSAGDDDIFVARYSAAGAHVWSKRFGNSSTDIGQSVAIDAVGNVFLTGMFSISADFGGGVLQSRYYNQDAFVAKFSPSGQHVWSRNLDSTSTDSGQAIALDATGNVGITGYFVGALTFATTPNPTALSSGRDAVFVAKLSGADGTPLWAKKFGVSDGARGFGIAFDHSGEVIVNGQIYNGSISFGGPTYTTKCDNDGFVAKLTGATGGYVWSRLLGGSSDTDRYQDAVVGVAVDANDNVTVKGWFSGTADFGGESLTPAGNAMVPDIFVAQFAKSDGARRWSKRFGGTSNDGQQNTAGGNITIDPTTNDVVATGSFLSASADFGGDTLTNTGGAGEDLYLVRMRS